MNAGNASLNRFSVLKGLMVVGILFPTLAYAAHGVDHADPISSVLLAVAALFFFALIGRYLAYRCKQPSVLGELLMGVLLGNGCYFLGFHFIVILREGSAIFDVVKELLADVPLDQAVNLAIPNPLYANQVINALHSSSGVEYLKMAYIIDMFSRYGVIFLLFMVGLESSVEELKHTGRESMLVALIGVVAPMVLGFVVAYWLLPNSSYQADLFIAATLSATSIGITARVLAETNQLHTREARTILGAAMIDDVLGLILLAVVSSIVINGSVNPIVAVKILVFALLFFIGAVLVGPFILRKMVVYCRFLTLWERKLSVSFLFIMVLAWLASLAQLAAIIGAFTAGVVLHDHYFKAKEGGAEKELTIRELIAPFESILAPIFFMVIGIQVKLETFYHWEVLGLAVGLIIAAIIGKLISGIGGHPKDDRWLIGIGMLPRGEVGLVFASIGRTLGVISDNLFSAIVLMVITTTFIAPPLLKARFSHHED